MVNTGSIRCWQIIEIVVNLCQIMNIGIANTYKYIHWLPLTVVEKHIVFRDKYYVSNIRWGSFGTNASPNTNTNTSSNTNTNRSRTEHKCKYWSQVNEFPWMVAFFNEDEEHICGATLVCTGFLFSPVHPLLETPLPFLLLEHCFQSSDPPLLYLPPPDFWNLSFSSGAPNSHPDFLNLFFFSGFLYFIFPSGFLKFIFLLQTEMQKA